MLNTFENTKWDIEALWWARSDFNERFFVQLAPHILDLVEQRLNYRALLTEHEHFNK